MTIFRIFVFLLIYFLFNYSSVISQEAVSKSGTKINIISKTESPISNALSRDETILLNSSGNIVGSFKGTEKVTESDSVKVIEVNLNSGGNFTVEPLHSLIVSENNSYLAVFGDHRDYDKLYRMYIKIYDSNGKRLISIDPGLYWPYDLKVYNNGDFMVAGKLNRNKKETYLRKYSSVGDITWEAVIPSGDIKCMEIAPNGSHIAILAKKNYAYDKQLLVYNTSGSLIYNEEYPEYYSDIDFISADKLILYSMNDWVIYNLRGNIEKSSKGFFNEKLLGRKPITGFDDGEKFFVLTANDNGEKYIIHVVDVKNGNILTHEEVEGPVTWKNYRAIKKNENNTFNFSTEKINLKFTIN